MILTLVLYGRKGQGAMEYLMTYGWAILVVMIIGATLWQLGIFNLGGGSTRSFSGFSEIRLIDWVFTPSGGFSGTFVNAAGTEIKVTGINITNSDGSSCFRSFLSQINWPDTPPVYDYPTYPSNNEFELLGSPGSWASAAGCVSGSAVVGDKYKIKVKIDYLKSIAGTALNHASVGFINGIYEDTCIKVCQAHWESGDEACSAIDYSCSSSSCEYGCIDIPAPGGFCVCTTVCCPTTTVKVYTAIDIGFDDTTSCDILCTNALHDGCTEDGGCGKMCGNPSTLWGRVYACSDIESPGHLAACNIVPPVGSCNDFCQPYGGCECAKCCCFDYV